MFHQIPEKILSRMRFLEQLDQQDRNDGTPRLKRLRQIPAETGQFLALLAAMAPQGNYLEIGTSAGYSTMWIALACRYLGRKLITYEILPEKVVLAKETFQTAGLEDVITLVEGDAITYLDSAEKIAFCFLDAEKEIYDQCYDKIVPKLLPGGILIADNAINHRETLQPMLDKALTDNRVDALIVPIGKGELLCRKL